MVNDKPTYEELEQSVKELEKEVAQQKQPADSILKDEQDKYNKLIQDSNDAIVIVQGIELRLANKAAYRMWGYQHEEEMADLKMTDMVSPKDLEMLLKRAEARERGKNVPSQYEFRARRKDGTEFLAEVSVSRIIYQGQLARQAVIRDITQQKLAEEALRKSEEKYKLLAENVTDAICVIDLDKLKFEYASPSVKKVFGYPVEEFMDLNMYDLLLPHSADLVMETITQELEKNKSGKAEPQLLELEVVRKDGLKICLGVSARFLRDNEGNVTSILCVARDISARKTAEAQLQKSEKMHRLLAENAKDTIFRQSLPGGGFEYISSAFKALTDYAPEELYNEPLLMREIIVHPDSADCFKEQWDKLLDGEISSYYEYKVVSKSGEIKWVNQRSVLIIDNKTKTPIAVEGIITDVTELKKAGEKLLRAKNSLEEKVKERTAEIEERGVALKVLLDQRGGEKKKLEESIMSNVKELLIPNINRLKSSTLSSKQQTAVTVLEANLNEIISPFSNSTSSSYMKLTPTEIQVANFIKYGASSKDIAESLCLSQRTVDTHRYNIRKKLGVSGKGINLRTYLLSLA